MKSGINASQERDEDADTQHRYKHTADNDETVIYDEESDDAWIESDIALDVEDCR
jgi:hypothetical protein